MVENRKKHLNPSITANRKPKLRESYKNFFKGLSPGVNFRRVPNFNRSTKTPQKRNGKKITKTFYGVLDRGALGENLQKHCAGQKHEGQGLTSSGSNLSFLEFSCYLQSVIGGLRACAAGNARIPSLGMPYCTLHNSIILSKSLAVNSIWLRFACIKDRQTTGKPLLVGFGKENYYIGQNVGRMA